MKIGIVGLGLIGGSLAKSVSLRSGHEGYGFDVNEETMQKALMSGAIVGELGENELKDTDILLVAVRPQAAIDYVKSHAAQIAKKAIVVDICGVKRRVCRELSAIAREYGFAYIGGHPMAGTENNGFDNASASLFADASMILTPDEHTGIEMLVTLKEFFLEIGFKNLTFSTPEEHDKIIAYTSQLAHITSSAYVKDPFAQEHMGFSAGSFKDMTRVAKLDENMWTELFLENTDNLIVVLERLIADLQPYLEALKARDAETLRALLKEGREIKAAADARRYTKTEPKAKKETPRCEP